ncbi:hypothetical protein [Mucisphaera sp.]|uniref:hypothetical protein n=1 Tax=Mucisphaera sp. TaxID=2913024 RepID=UPI003D0FC0FF
MKRQRLILMGVLGVGLAALVVDRLLLQSGATGPAEADAVVAGQAAAQSSSANGSPGVVESVGSLAEMMRLVGKLNQSAAAEEAEQTARNPFAILGGTVQQGGGRSVALTPEQRARDFGRRHRLRAVLRDRTGGRIMMGELTLRLGDQLEGFELVAIESHAATFEGFGYRVRIGY